MIETKISKTATDDETILAVTARDAFNTYGGLDGDPEEAGLCELRCLQVKLIRWEMHNFSVQPQWTTTLGIFEELGELIEAIGEARDEDIIDAIGDFMVYTVNLCTKLRLDFHNIMAHAAGQLGNLTGMDTLMAIWVNVGKLSHVILKSEQKIRGYKDVDVKRRDACIVISRLVSAVTELAFAADISAEATLIGVAEEVMQRDWIKYPVTGLPEIVPTTKAHETARFVDRDPPTADFVSVPETGKYQTGDGVMHYVVNGKEVSEEVFEAERR